MTRSRAALLGLLVSIAIFVAGDGVRLAFHRLGVSGSARSADDDPEAVAISAALDSLNGGRRAHMLGLLNGNLDALDAAAFTHDAAIDVLAQGAATPELIGRLPWPVRIAWLSTALSERRDDWFTPLLEGLRGTPPPAGSASRGEGALALGLCAERLLDRDPEEAEGYLKGEPNTSLADVATNAYLAAANEDFLLRDEAMYRLWRLAEGEGDSVAALQWADSLIAAAPRSLRIPAVRLTRARAYLAAGRHADAVEEGRRALPAADGAEVRWVIARGLLAMERPREAAQEIEQLLLAFPGDAIAVRAWETRLALVERDSALALAPVSIVRLLGALIPNPLLGAEGELRRLAGDAGVDPGARREAALVLGRAYYTVKRYDDLVSVLAPLREDADREAREESRLLIARSYRNRAQIPPMEGEYRALIETKGGRSALAAWELAREYESLARWGAAEAGYTAFLERFPKDPRVRDGLFRRGLARIRQKKASRGAEDFRAAYRLSRDRNQEEQAAFWLARTLSGMGDERGARTVAEASTTYPEPADAYGVLLRERFVPRALAVAYAETVTTHETVESLLDPTVWPEPLARYVERGLALARLGVLDAARREWRLAVELGEEYPTLVQALAVHATTAAVYPEAAQWGRRAADALPTRDPRFAPMRRLAYPAAYFDIVSREAARHDVDPLVIWALMRQESFYDPVAVSKKGALGLLQVMPATLLEMSGNGDPSLPAEALLIPRANIAVGIRWFAERSEELDGQLFPTLASYNAGVSKCREWIERAGGDAAEIFLEAIGYPETYDYVRRIVWLRWFYGATYHGELDPGERGSGG